MAPESVFCSVVECGAAMPCPRHGSGKLAEAVAAHRERTSALVAESLTAHRPDPELQALAEVVAALQRLDDAERARVLRYLNHRYPTQGQIGVTMNQGRGPGSAPPR